MARSIMEWSLTLVLVTSIIICESSDVTLKFEGNIRTNSISFLASPSHAYSIIHIKDFITSYTT